MCLRISHTPLIYSIHMQLQLILNYYTDFTNNYLFTLRESKERKKSLFQF